MRVTPLSVPIELAVGDVTFDLGEIELPIKIITGARNGNAVDVSVDLVMTDFHTDLADLLRKTADAVAAPAEAAERS